MKNVQIQAVAILTSFLVVIIAIQGCKTETIVHVHNGKPVTPTQTASPELATATTELPVDITMILDRSGSMQSMSDQVILSYNDFLDEQKTVDGEATISLVQFNHQYTPVYAGVDIQKASEIDTETYIADGYTALFDAIGRSIQEAKQRIKPGSADVVFVITTDGLENSSEEYSGKQIKELITECENDLGWNFMFLAANSDAFNQHEDLGMRYGASLQTIPSPEGYKEGQDALSSQLMLYRESRDIKELDFDDADRQTIDDEE